MKFSETKLSTERSAGYEGSLYFVLELCLGSGGNPSNPYLFREKTDEMCAKVGKWVVEGVKLKTN